MYVIIHILIHINVVKKSRIDVYIVLHLVDSIK